MVARSGPWGRNFLPLPACNPHSKLLQILTLLGQGAVGLESPLYTLGCFLAWGRKLGGMGLPSYNRMQLLQRMQPPRSFCNTLVARRSGWQRSG